MFGELGLKRSASRLCSAIAVTIVDVLALDQGGLLSVSREHPEFLQKIASAAGERDEQRLSALKADKDLGVAARIASGVNRWRSSAIEPTELHEEGRRRGGGKDDLAYAAAEAYGAQADHKGGCAVSGGSTGRFAATASAAGAAAETESSSAAALSHAAGAAAASKARARACRVAG